MKLEYNPCADRYELDGYELHCGERLSVRLPDGSWTETRIELGDGGWYLVGTPYRGYLTGTVARW